MSKTMAIIGGGASGLMCAITAKRRANQLKKDISVIILEKNSRVGKKLLSTGNGKCNLTNTNICRNAYHSNDIAFVQSVLDSFSSDKIIDFFEQIGITCISNNNLIYPRSMQASSVLDALRFEAQKLGVEFICDFDAEKIQKSNSSYIISGKTQNICADVVVIASGSSATTGSDTGLDILKSFGHKIYTPYPALTTLKSAEECIKTAKGMRADASITLVCDKKNIRTENGELLFCDYGFSGIAIMQLSGYVSKLFTDGKKHDVKLKIDFAPEYSFDELYSVLIKKRNSLSHLDTENLLCGFLNKRIGMTIIKHSNIVALSEPISSLDDKKIKKLAQTVKSFEMAITGTKGAPQAQVMGGGAALSDFYKDTLESKKSPKLFACGEVLDVYGDCGGYNLTWAWASGYICANSAAEII
ncbi:MAG: aminoacetone oxidase family FAD-binding enzyme [Ruminococcaceae bacterium]|nr:aminoacetone oxidase family FAD-binding enzyme [Oscillospiraceae bacterium]